MYDWKSIYSKIKNNWQLKLLALGMAFLLWFYLRHPFR